MTSAQRLTLFEKALAELNRRGTGYVLFEDAAHGDNYAELTSDFRAEISHRRWPACKLPPLGPNAMQRLDRLGFKESERNPTREFAGWAFPRIAKTLEQVFLEVYECSSEFELRYTAGE